MIGVQESYDFAAGGSGVALLGAGWSQPGAGGVWSLAGAAELRLPAPGGGAGGIALELTLDTQETFAVIRHRFVTISVNGAELATRRLGGRLCWHIDVPHDGGPDGAPPGAALEVRLRIAGSLPGTHGVKLLSCAVLRNLHAALPRPADAHSVFRFGWNEPTETMLGDGWGRPEDEFVWAIGGASALRVPLPQRRRPMLALLDMRPFHRHGETARQRVTIRVDGVAADTVVLADRLITAVDLPAAPGKSCATLDFVNHDADYATTDTLFHYGKPFAWALASLRIAPALPRYLAGFRPRLPGTIADESMPRAVAALTGLPAAALVGLFEGLGNGCELGLLQRSLGCEQAGLLRFAAVCQRNLVEGLLAGFQGVGRADRLHWAVRRPQDDTWRSVEESYGVSSATPYFRDRDRPENATWVMSRLLPRRADTLMQDVAGGEKIFVLRMSEAAGPACALAVLAALRHFGDADMIWLVSDGAGQPGSVERLPAGLIRGHLEAGDSGNEVSPDTMLSALANAYVLLRQAQRLPHDWQNS